MIKLKTLKYKFDKGPILLRDLKKDNFSEANCRLAVQYYFFKVHGLYFSPRSILNPRGYLKTGKFIIKEEQFNRDSIKLLKKGDVVYAEKIISKNSELTKEEWITKLHMAIYLGNNKIWHLSFSEGKSNVCDLNEFREKYNPVAAKRFL